MPTLQVELVVLLVGFVLSLVVTVVAIYLVIAMRVEQRIDDEEEQTRRQMDELRSQVRLIEHRLAEAHIPWHSDGQKTSRPISEEFDWKLHPGAP